MGNSSIARAMLLMTLKQRRRGTAGARRRTRPPRWLYPAATEARYERAHREWTRPARDFVRSYIEERREAILRGDGADVFVRRDAAVGASFAQMVKSLNGWIGAYISDDEAKRLESPIWIGLGSIADSAFDFNGKQWDKAAHSALGVDFPSDEDWWPAARETWQERNYALVKSDIQKYVADINAATERAVTSGWSWKELSARIRELDDGISKKRAAFIARDQIGKLNGQITQSRMTDAGLSTYEWSSSGDERVRPSHAAMDGKLCRWDDATVWSDDGGKTWKPRPAGAVHLHPGGDYQCRCCALARFDEVIAELEGDNAPLEPVPEDVRSVGKIGGYDFIKAGLADGERRAFADDLGRVSKEHLKTLEKYAQDMRADFHAASAYYSPSENKIYLDITKKNATDAALGYKTNMVDFLHESGHWLDHNMLGNGGTVRANLPDLRKKLEADLLTYCNNVLKLDEPLKSVKDLTGNRDAKRIMCADLKTNPDMKNGVSDIFCGLTKTEVVGKWGHWQPGYWSGDMLERETVANFFEARGAGGEKLNILKQYFPVAYEYFDSYIRGLK